MDTIEANTENNARQQQVDTGTGDIKEEVDSSKTNSNKQHHSNQEVHRDMDRGWAWMVLLGACGSSFLVSLWLTGGLFNIYFLEEFGKNRQVTSWLTAIQTGVASWSGIVSSLLIHKFGVRWAMIVGATIGSLGYFLTYFATSFGFVIFSFSILVGSGVGICSVPALVVTGIYFDKYRNVCIGLTATSFAVGNMLLPLFIEKMQGSFGWRGCMLILSGLYLHNVISGVIFRAPVLHKSPKKKHNIDGPSASIATDTTTKYGPAYAATLPAKEASISSGMPSQKGSPEQNNSGRTMTKARMFIAHLKFIKHYGFVMVWVNFLLINVAGLCVFIHFPAFFVAHGATDLDISTSFIVLGVASIFYRLTGGIATNSDDVDPLLVYSSACGILSIITFMCPLMVATYTGQLVYSGLVGLFANTMYSLVGPVSIQLVGVKNFAWAYGLLSIAGGIGGIIGPPVAGWLYDITGTYVFSFYFAGSAYLLSTIIIFLVPILDSKYKSRRKPQHRNQTASAEGSVL